MENKIKSLLFGSAIGDALGVPFEFKTKGTFTCVDMIGYGTHNQPKGTWSDDTSMTLCLADEISEGMSIENLARKFLRWYELGEFTVDGNVFDIGNTTVNALMKFKSGDIAEKCGGTNEYDNGNGSLMRIASLVFFVKDMNFEDRFELVKKVSSITHAHELSIVCCSILIEVLLKVLQSISKNTIKDGFMSYLTQYKGIISDKTYNTIISYFTSSKNNGSGYVLDTLKSSLKCFFNTNSYKDAVLKAVNLGNDTDTTGSVTGAIAGLYYGYNSIPNKWIDCLRNKKLINDISERMSIKVGC